MDGTTTTLNLELVFNPNMTYAGHVMGMFSGVNTGLGGGRFVVILDLTHTHTFSHTSHKIFRSTGYLGYGEAEGRRIGILP